MAGQVVFCCFVLFKGTKRAILSTSGAGGHPQLGGQAEVPSSRLPFRL